MKLLVLGGTVFVGRHIVETALEAGHEVSIFTRGQHGPELFPDVEKLRGDRDGDLSALGSGDWDAVVDTSAYFPRQVRASVDALAGRVGHYTFISSGSVYADQSVGGRAEDAPVIELPADQPEELSSPEAYGGFKVLCERALPAESMAVRAGLIVGPYDPTNRFTYWVTRLARGGETLVPEPASQPVQWIDARDLAEWILRSAEAGLTGVFNAIGPAEPATLGDVLERMSGDAELVWTAEQWLVDHDVEPFQDLPLWLAPTVDPDWAAFFGMDASKAIAAGLTFRPLEETVAATLEWARHETPGPKDIGVAMAPGGLSPERERELLDAWKAAA